MASSKLISGKIGNALQFDGVDDYVDAGNAASLNITNAITVEGWAKASPSSSITQTWQVGTSSDDCTRTLETSNWNINSNYLYVGYYASTMEQMGSAARFLNVTIPAGSTITLANFKITVIYDTGATTVNTRLRAEKNVSPATFSTAADFDARTWTTAYVNWDTTSAWTQETEYTSPDIKTAIQEVINLSGWASGNPIVVLWDDFQRRNTITFRARMAYSYDASTTKAPKLVITYTLPPKTIVSKGNDAYALKMSADGSTLYGYINSTAITASVSTPANWHHYALTYDGANQKLYIDGVQANSSALTGAIATNAINLKLGDLFSGPIDEVRIYNRSLSADEIQQHYNHHKLIMVVSNPSNLNLTGINMLNVMNNKQYVNNTNVTIGAGGITLMETNTSKGDVSLLRVSASNCPVYSQLTNDTFLVARCE